MSKDFKIFGITLIKGTTSKVPATGDKRRARQAIKPVPKREVSWQIEDIKTALTLAKNLEKPDRNRLFQIYDYIMKDLHLKSQIRVAKNEVLSEPWQIYLDKGVDEATSQALLKRWFNHIIEYILEAEFFGFSLVECDKIDTANFTIGEVVSIPRDYVSIEKQLILIDGSINGSVLPYGEIMQQIDLLEFGKRDDYGILLECAYNVIWKYYSRSDWSRGSEKFGMPILSIEADTNNDAELDALEAKAASFGTDGYIVTQKGDAAKLIERTGQRIHDIWLDNIKLCNDEVSKGINGQTGSSDEKAFVGSAQVQERILQGFTAARLQNIVDEINEKVFPYLKAKGFQIPDDAKFDYPILIRERERKLNGSVPTANNEEPTTEEKEKPEQKPNPSKK